MTAAIDYYFSMVSPWAYIGHDAFHEMAARRSASIAYKPVALLEVFERTDTPALPKRHPTRRAYRMLELQRWRVKRGLDFKLEPAHWPFPFATADSMVIAAAQAGHDPAAFMRRAFAVIWEEDGDLSEPSAVAAVADEVGLPGGELLEAAESDAVAATYAENTDKLVEIGGFGSPIYVLGGEIFWGQDRIDLLEDAIASGRVPYVPAA